MVSERVQAVACMINMFADMGLSPVDQSGERAWEFLSRLAEQLPDLPESGYYRFASGEERQMFVCVYDTWRLGLF